MVNAVKPGDSLSKPECQICYETIHSKDKIIALVCAHLFHQKCITDWHKEAPTCPICRVNAFNAKELDLSEFDEDTKKLIHHLLHERNDVIEMRRRPIRDRIRRSWIGRIAHRIKASVVHRFS